MSDLTKTLDDILKDIPSLQNLDDYTPNTDFSEETAICYDEFITKDMAKMILGNKYNPKCEYKMLTQSDSTVIYQIDKNWPEDKEPVYDMEGRIIAGPLVEIVLEETTSKDAQSYAEMIMSIERSKDHVSSFNTPNYFQEPKRSKWIYAVAGASAFIVLIWAAVMFFLFYVI